jgi:hypothetical protein
MTLPDDARMFEALLCTLLVGAGGEVALPAREVARCGNRYRLAVQADRGAAAVVLAAAVRPRAPRRPRR